MKSSYYYKGRRGRVYMSISWDGEQLSWRLKHTMDKEDIRKRLDATGAHLDTLNRLLLSNITMISFLPRKIN